MFNKIWKKQIVQPTSKVGIFKPKQGFELEEDDNDDCIKQLKDIILKLNRPITDMVKMPKWLIDAPDEYKSWNDGEGKLSYDGEGKFLRWADGPYYKTNEEWKNRYMGLDFTVHPETDLSFVDIYISIFGSLNESLLTENIACHALKTMQGNRVLGDRVTIDNTEFREFWRPKEDKDSFETMNDEIFQYYGLQALSSKSFVINLEAHVGSHPYNPNAWENTSGRTLIENYDSLDIDWRKW